MLKILQVRLQQYMKWELPNVQAELEKAEEPEVKLPTSWTIEKPREIEKNICFIGYTKAFGCVDHTNCGKFLKRWEYQTTLPVS